MPKSIKTKSNSAVIEADPPAEAEIEQPTGAGLAIVQRPPVIGYLQPVMDLDTAKARLLEFQRFIKFYLVEGEDYGIIPGTTKPTLLKPGAEKLCELYGLAPTFPDDRIKRVEKWDMEPSLFDYEVTCVLKQKSTDIVAGEGMGSCNSWESKYRWRDQHRRCPVCGKEAIIQSKYGPGWFCFPKKGGCGSKFMEADPKIVEQPIGRVPNDSAADLKNTVLKIAKKRALVDATIAATRSSGIFNQDLENIVEAEKINENGNGNGDQAQTKVETKAPVVEPQSTSAPLVEYSTAPLVVDDENPTLNDYKEWLPQCRKLGELETIFKQAYKQFWQEPEVQAVLRTIYEAKKVELGGTPNPEGVTNKTRKQGKNANGRN